MSWLRRIVEQKRAEVMARSVQASPSMSAPFLPRSPELALQSLRRSPGAPLALIAEVKFASPSAGALSRKLDAAARAIAYATSGASMVSVLCDETFFAGGLGDLTSARAALDAAGLRVPLLAKDFIVDPVQIDWAKAHGADAVLVIVRILEGPGLDELIDRAQRVGLEPFVEVTTDDERDRALAAGARIVGVNARDLDTLAVDVERAARVLGGIPREVVGVHLSGLNSPDRVRAVARGRADAALIGEALMRVDDPKPVLREFVRAAAGG